MGNTRHGGEDLRVGWRERRGWTGRCTDDMGGESGLSVVSKKKRAKGMQGQFLSFVLKMTLLIHCQHYVCWVIAWGQEGSSGIRTGPLYQT